MNEVTVGVLGATVTVGQRFIQLLADHPWFKVTALAASDRSAGQRYADICHWLPSKPMPEGVRDVIVRPTEHDLDCQLVFSALPSGLALPVEQYFARAGYEVCSNAAAHRMDTDVPLLIPEVNANHTALIDVPRHRRGWRGFIVTSANCSATQLTLAVKPWQDAFGLCKVSVVTTQAVSGAGYPGVAAMDILDNVIPFVSGEEVKAEREPLRLLVTLQDAQVANAPFVISAQCNRAPIRDGHTEYISVEFERKPEIGEAMAALEGFHGPPKVANLPNSPTQPICVQKEPDRAQPIRDRDAQKGMSVSVDRVRPCPVFDVKVAVLGHNTLRGAAGGSIHNAELLVAQQWVT